MSWKAQKDQVNITFTSTFWLKKRPLFPITDPSTFCFKKCRIFHPRKNQNSNKSVASTIIFSLTFVSKRDRISHSRKVQNKNFLVINKYHISINFLAQKRPYFPPPKNSKLWLFSNQ